MLEALQANAELVIAGMMIAACVYVMFFWKDTFMERVEKAYGKRDDAS